MKALSRNNIKILCASALFVLLTAIKLLFPEQTAPARAAIREVISRDADYTAVFREIGQGLAGDEEVREVLLEMTGRADAMSASLPYSPGTLSELIEEQTGFLPQGDPVSSSGEEVTPTTTPEPTPTPTPEPTPEPVPEAVTAFLEQQEQFSAYAVPSNVSYGYPELPFSYTSPVEGMTSSGFGYRMHPLRNEVLFHYGTDFAAWTGTEILAFADGTVGMVGWDAGYGNYIIVQHADGWRTLYAHCSAVYVTGGDTVTAGQCIGLVGATGDVTGPHLHLELTCNGVYYNPEFYLS